MPGNHGGSNQDDDYAPHLSAKKTKDKRPLEVRLEALDETALAELQRNLNAETARRAEIRKQQERVARIERNQNILKHKQMLLALVKHGRTSCDDNNRANAYTNESGYPRCNRCVLLDLEEWNIDQYEIKIDVEIREVS